MNNALSWIGDLVAWIVQFIPKWIIIPTTHKTVKWVHGNKPIIMDSGIHWYWPLVTIIKSWPVVRQSRDLTAQVMTSTDGKTFSAGVVVTYTVPDLLTLLTLAWDPDEVVDEVSVAAIYDVLSVMSWEEIQISTTLTKQLTKAIQALLKPYGVKIVRAALTELAPCRVIKLITSPSPTVVG